MAASSRLVQRVTRINPAGSSAKVTLRAADGQDVIVKLSLDRYRELALQRNDEVFVNATQSRVFVPEYVPDYAI